MSPRAADSQVDSQLDGQPWTRAGDHGMCEPAIELWWTLMDGCGCKTRGLQNRLRGAAEASWVGSIPIHPRHLEPTFSMTRATSGGEPPNTGANARRAAISSPPARSASP